MKVKELLKGLFKGEVQLHVHFRKITKIVEDGLEIGKARAETPASTLLYYF